MTLDELRAIRERCEAASVGPWTVNERPRPHGWWSVEDATGREVFDDGSAGAEYSPTCSIADRDFLVAARADLPALLAEVERLTRERDAYAQSHRILKGVHGALADGGCVVPPLDSFEVEETIRSVCNERDELLVRVANADAELRATRESYNALRAQLSSNPKGFEQ